MLIVKIISILGRHIRAKGAARDHTAPKYNRHLLDALLHSFPFIIIIIAIPILRIFTVSARPSSTKKKRWDILYNCWHFNIYKQEK